MWKMYGAVVVTGVDGVGLSYLPDELPEVRNPLDLPLFSGNKDALERAVSNTVAILEDEGFHVGEPTLSSKQRTFWARPTHQAIIRADR